MSGLGRHREKRSRLVTSTSRGSRQLAPSASPRPLRKGQLCGWCFAAARATLATRATFTVATLATRATFTVATRATFTVATLAARATLAVATLAARATLARSCVHPFGYTLCETSNTLVGFFLSQVTRNNMFLDVCGLGVDDGVNDGSDSNTLIRSDISDALPSLTSCLQHVFANT